MPDMNHTCMNMTDSNSHLSFKGYPAGSQHLRARDGRRVRRGEGLLWIDGFHVLRNGRKGLAKACAVRVRAGEAPLKLAAAEFLARRNRLRRAQRFGRAGKPAARVVLFRRAAALDTRAGEGNFQNSVRNTVVRPRRSKGTSVQRAMFSQPRSPFFSTAVLNSTQPCASSQISALMRSEDAPAGSSARMRSCSAE